MLSLVKVENTNSSSLYCVVPESIHTHPTEGHWKFQGGGASEQPKLGVKYEDKLGIQEGGRVQMEQSSIREVWIFFWSHTF